MSTQSVASLGTFRSARTLPIHRWFPWIEGFDPALPGEAIDREGPSRVWDPFLGSGTTAVVASHRGVVSSGAEVNPFLRFVTATKADAATRLCAREPDALRALFAEALARAADGPPPELSPLFADARYFDAETAEEIARLKQGLHAAIACPDALALGRLALASVLVECSTMIRRADLRRRRPEELPSERPSAVARFAAAVERMVEDLAAVPPNAAAYEPALTDARQARLPDEPLCDLAVTSPPYLNGTNYVRNTKLELWVLDLASSPEDLRRLRDRGISAGINNVSRSRPSGGVASRLLEEVLVPLAASAYDARIPRLVAGYFGDMAQALAATRSRLRPGARLHLDIGDSRFAGVHVPTDRILREVAEQVGFRTVAVEKLRDRRSKDGSSLQQVLLVLQAPPRRRASPARRLARMTEEQPFRQPPYAARNWGHPWHSMCSYQAKLKPSIAHFLVREFSSPGDVVLDPFGGAGTVPFEACLQGRVGWGNDINPLAACLLRAKARRPADGAVRERLERLLESVDAHRHDVDPAAVAGFGFNGELAGYYHPATLAQVLAARAWFREQAPDAEASLLLAATAHILHGNRPYALSRRSHPITPFAPSGPFEPRELRPRLTAKVERLLAAPFPDAWRDGRTTTVDAATIDDAGAAADVVITSPPFFGSTRFHVNNWIRFWFCGWSPEDFATRRDEFIEHRQARDMSVYAPILAALRRLLRPGALAVLHLGKSARCDMGQAIAGHAEPWFELAGSFEEAVHDRQRHGVSSQGVTTTHQFVLLTAR